MAYGYNRFTALAILGLAGLVSSSGPALLASPRACGRLQDGQWLDDFGCLPHAFGCWQVGWFQGAPRGQLIPALRDLSSLTEGPASGHGVLSTPVSRKRGSPVCELVSSVCLQHLWSPMSR